MVGFMKGLGCGCCGGCWTGLPQGLYSDDFTTQDSGWTKILPANQSAWVAEWAWVASLLRHSPTAFGVTEESFTQRFTSTQYEFYTLSGMSDKLLFEMETDVLISRPATPSGIGSSQSNSIGIIFENAESTTLFQYQNPRFARMGLVWTITRLSATTVRTEIYAQLFQWTGYGNEDIRLYLYNSNTPYTSPTYSGRVAMKLYHDRDAAVPNVCWVDGFWNTTQLSERLFFSLPTLAGSPTDQRASRLCKIIAILTHWASATGLTPSMNLSWGEFDNYEHNTYT